MCCPFCPSTLLLAKFSIRHTPCHLTDMNYTKITFHHLGNTICALCLCALLFFCFMWSTFVFDKYNSNLNRDTESSHSCGELTWMFWMLSSNTSLAAVRMKWTSIPDSVVNTSSSGTLLTKETPRPSSKFTNTCEWIQKRSHRICFS